MNSTSLIVQKFNYLPLTRTNEDGIRKYSTPDGNRLPSVTSILTATKSQESLVALQEWRNRVGHAKAQEITTEAAGCGTSMHSVLERHILGTSRPPGTNLVHQIAYPMAQVIINNGLINMDEIWGNEVAVYYEGLYAGSTDGTGVWKGNEAIFDFKQSNKPKKREYIEDYFLQTVFYGTAHNKMFNTNIRTGVIMICTKACEYQEFVLEDKDWDKYEGMMWDKVEQYYLKKA